MLALTETNRLAELEAVIDAGFDTYIAVGQALATIKDERLYLNSHTNFRDYLQDRFGISRSHGYNLINAAAAAAMVEGDVKQTVALALSDLPVEAIRHGWSVVKGMAGDKPITVALVKSVVNVLNEALHTSVVNNHEGGQVAVNPIYEYAILEDLSESIARNKQRIADHSSAQSTSAMVVEQSGTTVTLIIPEGVTLPKLVKLFYKGV
jgi:hypothetical protein